MSDSEVTNSSASNTERSEDLGSEPLTSRSKNPVKTPQSSETKGIQELDYDVVIYGTSLVNCLVGSVLTKRNIRVLHVDRHSDYGNNLRTLNFKSFLNSFLRKNTDVNTARSDNNEELVNNYELLNNFLPFHDPLNSTPHTQLNNSVNTIQQSSSHSDLQDDTVDKMDEHDIPDEFDEMKMKKKVMMEMLNENNKYNIDLYPKLLVNNSPFVKFLLFTNLHKNLQLFTNTQSNILFTLQSTLSNKLNTVDTGSQTTDTLSNGEKEGNSDENTGKSKADKKMSDEPEFDLVNELVFDKNSISHSKYLTLTEKRLLYKFFKELSGSDQSDPNASTASTEHSGDERSGINSRSDREEDNLGWSSFLRQKYKLNDKLLAMVNYCILLNSTSESEALGKRAEWMQMVKNYLSNFKKNKNYAIYFLYGTSNVVQNITRLSSLHNCHFMLSNTIHTTHLVHNVNLDDSVDSVDKEPESVEVERSRLLLKLDGYNIYTKFLFSEYRLDGENEVDRLDECVLVLYIISNKKLFEGFNLCVVIPDHLSDTVTKSDGMDKVDPVDREVVYVLQTCKESYSTPDDKYLVYFMTKITGSQAEYLHNFKFKDDLYDFDEDNMVLKLLSCYKRLNNDELDNVLYINYNIFNNSNFVNIYSPNSNSVNPDDLVEQGLEIKVCDDKKVYRFEYKNDNVMLLKDEINVSHKISQFFLNNLHSSNSSNTADDSQNDSDLGLTREQFSVFNNYLRYNNHEEEEDELFDLNCDFLNDLVNKFF